MKLAFAVIILLLLFNSAYAFSLLGFIDNLKPDSKFYFLDVLVDKITVSLIANKEEKIEKMLAIAEERRIEFEEMAIKNDTKSAIKAKDEHAKTLQEINVTVSSEGDSEKQIENVMIVELNLKTELKKIEVLFGTIQKVTQNAEILSLISEINNKTGNIVKTVETKKMKL